jgi:4-amino-4-deoxy-L-arabinose transferase-like glycosyltransferase
LTKYYNTSMNIFSNKKKILLCLLLLIVISFSIRIYKVDTAPSGVSPDEASWGYNAYSILETGKDEHGVSYPIIFQAFGDQKLPLYIYSLVPSIRAFGLNNFSIRLPAAIVGTLVTLAIFFFLMKFGFSTETSFIGAFITATSPWQIILSRIFGYDSNLGLLFFILGLLFSFMVYKKSRLLYAILSGICFGLTLYSYVAFRLISPVILLSFILIYMRNVKLFDLKRAMLLVSFLVVICPLIFLSFAGKGNVRLNQASSTTNSGVALNINENRYFCNQTLPKLLCYINSNKVVAYSRNYLSRYMYVFSPDYIFISGEKDDNFLNVENFGLLSIILLPFYLLGLLYLWNRIITKSLTKNELFLIVGLMVAPLPAILVDMPQKVRISALFPFYIILILYGVSQAKDFVKKFINEKVYYVGLILLLIIFNIFFMINFLAVHVNKYDVVYGDYIPKLMQYLNQQDKKTQIYIASIDEGIEYYAYVNKVDPSIFQKKVIREKPDAIGFAQATDLENIHVTKSDIYQIYCESKMNKTHSLYVTKVDYQQKLGHAKKIISLRNGTFKMAFVYDMNEINNKDIKCK